LPPERHPDEPQKIHGRPNAFSLAQALFSKKAWYRAIYAGKAAVGFLMLWDDDEEPNYFLWRFMIAEPCRGAVMAHRQSNAWWNTLKPA